MFSTRLCLQDVNGSAGWRTTVGTPLPTSAAPLLSFVLPHCSPHISQQQESSCWDLSVVLFFVVTILSFLLNNACKRAPAKQPRGFLMFSLFLSWQQGWNPSAFLCKTLIVSLLPPNDLFSRRARCQGRTKGRRAARRGAARHTRPLLGATRLPNGKARHPRTAGSHKGAPQRLARRSAARPLQSERRRHRGG